MFKFCSLFSGSSGNCLLVESENSKVLIDAGGSAKKIVDALSLVGVVPEDLKAIQDWKAAGNKFAIVTGRSKESIQKQIEQYNIPVDYIVTNNGGMVFDKDGNTLLSNYLDYITSLDVIYAAKSMEGVCSYVVNDGIYRHRIIIDDANEHRYPNLDPDMSEEDVLNMGKYAQIVLSMAEIDLAISMADAINQYFGESVVAYANNYVVDVVPKGVSKATGLDFVCEWSGISEKDTYTIGDSYNDIPMLESADCSFTFHDSPQIVQEKSTHIVSSISEAIEMIND